MKMAGNFVVGVGRHLVDVSRNDGKFQLSARRMESKHSGD